MNLTTNVLLTVLLAFSCFCAVKLLSIEAQFTEARVMALRPAGVLVEQCAHSQQPDTFIPACEELARRAAARP